MPCDQCHERDAVIHLTQIVDEQVTTLHLCEKCAAEKGVEGAGLPPKSPLGDFLAAMGQGGSGAAAAAADREACPTCGATFTDFRDSGRVGCADCYRSFEAQLRDLLRRLHGSTHHAGERYAVTGAEPGAEPRAQDQLRDQLRLAVETENFELAAELRDRIRAPE